MTNKWEDFNTERDLPLPVRKPVWNDQANVYLVGFYSTDFPIHKETFTNVRTLIEWGRENINNFAGFSIVYHYNIDSFKIVNVYLKRQY